MGTVNAAHEATYIELSLILYPKHMYTNKTKNILLIIGDPWGHVQLELSCKF